MNRRWGLQLGFQHSWKGSTAGRCRDGGSASRARQRANLGWSCPRLWDLSPKKQVLAIVHLRTELKKAIENRPRSRGPVSPVPGTAGSIVEVLSATTKTDTPEHMAAVMATLPVMVQVVVLKAVTEDATPRTVRGAAAHCRVHVLRLLWRRGTPPPDTGQADGRIADLLQQLSEMPAFKRTPWPRGAGEKCRAVFPVAITAHVLNPLAIQRKLPVLAAESRRARPRKF